MSKAEKYLLALWFLSNLIIGLLTVPDFGVSYDEPDYYLYAQNTVDAYKSFFTLAYTPVFGPHDLPNYGPAFIIFPELILRLARLAFPDLAAAHLWHFSYFLLFQLGGMCLYALARRWFSLWSSWGILLLYTSQPLLWGHAFINPKDVPFMAFFLFTLWSGFHLADSFGAAQPTIGDVFSKGGRLSFPRVTVKQSLPYLRSSQMLLAGGILGMTMSIRLLGPLPGLIVILYISFTLGQKAIPVIIAYLMCATVVMFLTWPYLWPNPIGHWIDSLVLMVNFPWPGRVLFNGQFYDAVDLPLSYLPLLLNLQLTETLLIFIYLGLAVLLVSLWRRSVRLDLFLVTVVGGLIPLLALIASRATMYDNFRQVLFLVPPLILVAGIGLEVVFSVVKPNIMRWTLLVVLAVPGWLAIVQLHPYQYVYYNTLTGGTDGAFRKFELDYWSTTYAELAGWINQNAPAKARVDGNPPDDVLAMYLREDLLSTFRDQSGEPFHYFVMTSRYNQDLSQHPNAKVVYSIEREGAILAVVKQLSP